MLSSLGYPFSQTRGYLSLCRPQPTGPPSSSRDTGNWLRFLVSETLKCLQRLGNEFPTVIVAWALRQTMGHLKGMEGRAWCGGSTVSLVATQLLAWRMTRYGVWAGRFCQHSASSSVALKAAPFLTVFSPRSGFRTPLPWLWQGCLHHGGQFFVLLLELFPELHAHMCFFFFSLPPFCLEPVFCIPSASSCLIKVVSIF